MRYRLVEEETISNLNATVNDLLEDGWELYGSPSISEVPTASNFIQTYVQAMIIN